MPSLSNLDNLNIFFINGILDHSNIIIERTKTFQLLQVYEYLI